MAVSIRQFFLLTPEILYYFQCEWNDWFMFFFISSFLSSYVQWLLGINNILDNSSIHIFTPSIFVLLVFINTTCNITSFTQTTRIKYLYHLRNLIYDKDIKQLLVLNNLEHYVECRQLSGFLIVLTKNVPQHQILIFCFDFQLYIFDNYFFFPSRFPLQCH